MKWDIYEYASGCIVATVEARTAREALLKYLMDHEELNDMMLWKSTDRQDGWRLAEYDNEDEFLYAKANWQSTTLWEFFLKLPGAADIRVLDAQRKVTDLYTTMISMKPKFSVWNCRMTTATSTQ